MLLLDKLDEEMKKKLEEEKNLVSLRQQRPAHTSIIAWVKLDYLYYELLPHPPYSPDLARLLFVSKLKKMGPGKRFSTNEQVISETEAYFTEFDKPYFSKGINMLEDRWKKCISLERDYVED